MGESGLYRNRKVILNKCEDKVVVYSKDVIAIKIMVK